MAAVVEDGDTPVSDTATLSERQRSLLSQILQDVRTTVQHLSLPDVNPLSATDATALEALKDLYYMLNVEDPLNALPARQYVFSSRVVQTLLHPIIVSLHSHPSASANQKRWSVPTYQALRTLCVLSTPIPDANQFLPKGCALDVYCTQLCSFLAHNSETLDALVSLLQYYLERKAAKIEALASAESCRLEDARIDNILTFFRNILSPPRVKPGDPLRATDAGTHLALVSALHKADFYATLSVLFSSSNQDEMRLHTTNTVFLTVDIYAFTFRHSSPKSMFHTLRSHPYLRQVNAKTPGDEEHHSSADCRIPPKRAISKTRSSALRAALLKERAAIGGSRAVSAAARWSNRHSGSFSFHKASDPEARPATVAVPIKSRTKRIISSKAMVQSRVSFNPRRPFQEAVLVNSQVLCLWAAKKRNIKLPSMAGRAVEQVRKDLQDSGLQALVKIASEFIDMNFSIFARESRNRIAETKERTKLENPETLTRAQRSFLYVVGCVVGFQRERHGKVRKEKLEEIRALNADMHQNHMKAVLSADLKILRKDWKVVEAAIEVETFQLAFRVLVESFEALRTTGKDEVNIESIEVATFAVLEMMKMLQGMSAHAELQEKDILEQTAKENTLTPRELALNTLEDLFREEVFLNAPANLAKDFNSKIFSFRHLTNIVELGYTFTSILMDEEELQRLQVNKKKRNRKKKPAAQKGTLTKDDEELRKAELQHEEVSKKPSAGNDETGTEIDCSTRNSRRANRITEDSDDDEPVGVELEKSSKMVHENHRTKDAVAGREQSEKPEFGTAREKVFTTSDPPNPTHSSSGAVKTDEDISPLQPLTKKANPDSEQETVNGNEPEALSEGPQNRVAEEQKNDRGQMLEEDADDEPETPSQGNQSNTKKSSKIKEMLRADVLSEANARAKGKTEKARRMLMADVENEGKSLQAKFVTTINKAISEGITLRRKEGEDGRVSEEGDGKSQSGKSDGEPEMQEMESMGIIRRFAHIRAIHTFTLPVRAMICNSVALTGESYPIPDGSKMLLSPLLAAKSVHLLAAIWKVAKLRERGSLCGQFFTLGNMQFMEIMLNAPLHCNVKQFSVLASLGELARDVTKTFFEWLSINPGLTLDMVFGMDKGSCQMYTAHIRQKSIQDAKENKDKDSGNDSDIAHLEIEPPPRSSRHEGGTKSRKRKGSKSYQERAVRRRQRQERPKLESDEDVDDMDNLNIGVVDSGDEYSDDANQASLSMARSPNSLERAQSKTEKVRAPREQKKKSRSRGKPKSESQRRQKERRPRLVEDEDVDDLDILNFGVTDSEVEPKEDTVDNETIRHNAGDRLLDQPS